jgi:hypothetical protein
MMHLAQPTSRARFLRDADLSQLLDQGESAEEWLSGHPDARFFSSAWDGTAALFLQTAGFELIFVRQRRPNPIDPAAFAPMINREIAGAHHEDWSAVKLEDAMNVAEERFGVKLMGGLYGCGMYGCAAPLEGDMILKVTMDDMEATWATLCHQHKIPGMVRIVHPPVVVAQDDWNQGDDPEEGEEPMILDIFAYVREETDDVSRSTEPTDEIRRGVRKFARLGYRVGDYDKPDNLGLDSQGKLVLRDGRAARLLKKKRS